MTLDEAIRHAEEVASRMFDDRVHCIKCAEEHRQLAEWLRDYKRLKEQESTGHWITKIKSDLGGDMWSTNPKCSKCGGEPYYSNTIYNYKFCPYCGARMESEDKE